jgi:hypothetical protein
MKEEEEWQKKERNRREERMKGGREEGKGGREEGRRDRRTINSERSCNLEIAEGIPIKWLRPTCRSKGKGERAEKMIARRGRMERVEGEEGRARRRAK